MQSSIGVQQLPEAKLLGLIPSSGSMKLSPMGLIKAIDAAVAELIPKNDAKSLELRTKLVTRKLVIQAMYLEDYCFVCECSNRWFEGYSLECRPLSVQEKQDNLPTLGDNVLRNGTFAGRLTFLEFATLLLLREKVFAGERYLYDGFLDDLKAFVDLSGDERFDVYLSQIAEAEENVTGLPISKSDLPNLLNADLYALLFAEEG